LGWWRTSIMGILSGDSFSFTFWFPPPDAQISIFIFQRTHFPPLKLTISFN
jgi:hypothetical protein